MSNLTDQQFQQYFCMSKSLFQKLCDSIKDSVGAEKFKSEQYLDARLMSLPKQLNNIFHVHLASTGGMISGEVKLA